MSIQSCKDLCWYGSSYQTWVFLLMKEWRWFISQGWPNVELYQIWWHWWCEPGIQWQLKWCLNRVGVIKGWLSDVMMQWPGTKGLGMVIKHHKRIEGTEIGVGIGSNTRSHKVASSMSWIWMLIWCNRMLLWLDSFQSTRVHCAEVKSSKSFASHVDIRWFSIQKFIAKSASLSNVRDSPNRFTVSFHITSWSRSQAECHLCLEYCAIGFNENVCSAVLSHDICCILILLACLTGSQPNPWGLWMYTKRIWLVVKQHRQARNIGVTGPF